MKQISTLLLIALTAIVFTSCSENTVGGGMIQKRKHTKGFYLNRHSSGRAADNDASAEVSAVKEEKTEKIRPAVKQEALVSEVNETPVAQQEELAVTEPVVEPEAAFTDAPFAQETTTREDKTVVAKNEAPQKQQQISERKTQMRSAQHQSAAAAESAVLVILLVILAFFLPWLSVLLYEGATGRFWIILLLWLLAIIGFFWPIAYALAVIAVVYAILIVLGIV